MNLSSSGPPTSLMSAGIAVSSPLQATAGNWSGYLQCRQRTRNSRMRLATGSISTTSSLRTRIPACSSPSSSAPMPANRHNTVTQPSSLVRSDGLGWPSTGSTATARSHRLSSSRRYSLSPRGSPRCTHREVPSSLQCSTSMAINVWGNSSHGASGSKGPKGINLFSAASRSAASPHSTLGSLGRRT
jgi:hypothetical protein